MQRKCQRLRGIWSKADSWSIDPDALGKIATRKQLRLDHFLQEKLPHVDRLLVDKLEDAVAPSQVVVIGHSGPRFAQDEAWRAQGKAVLRLA